MPWKPLCLLSPAALAKEAAFAALRLILEHYANASDASHAQTLMEAGYLGGVAAANCSVGAIHAFAHTMAAYGMPHGYANALGLIAGHLRQSGHTSHADAVTALWRAVR